VEGVRVDWRPRRRFLGNRFKKTTQHERKHYEEED
jgi:hypothetical protein